MSKETKFVCMHPWTHFEVNNPNGEVTMCCDNNTVLGNVNQNTLTEIWNGDGFSDIRRRMRDEGAHAICPHTCPVLNGGKTYQSLDWYKELAEGAPARRNAETNEREFHTGNLILDSLPRWMRFTYSYLCNLDCYHCYQREDATQNIKLPDRFMDEVRSLSRIYQVVFPFGGEPFLFKPVLDFLESSDVDPGCRYFFVTNATLLTDRILRMLKAQNLGMIAVSLDGADAATFDELRVRGRRADWAQVMENLRKLQVLKQEKQFRLPISMTLNKRNFDQIEKFVDLSLSYDGEPQIMLVTNPYGAMGFQKQYLNFRPTDFEEMFAQIERSLEKVRGRGLAESETSLLSLRAELRQHRNTDNSLIYYAGKKAARNMYRVLPESLQQPLKRVVQALRVRRFRHHADAAE